MAVNPGLAGPVLLFWKEIAEDEQGRVTNMKKNYYVTQGGWEIKEMIKESGNFRNASQGKKCLVIFRYTYRRM